jgi:hypothetical protein
VDAIVGVMEDALSELQYLRTATLNGWVENVLKQLLYLNQVTGLDAL